MAPKSKTTPRRKAANATRRTKATKATAATKAGHQRSSPSRRAGPRRAAARRRIPPRATGTGRNRPHVLVTGGAGFIGSHLVQRLVAAGNQVTVLDDFSHGTLQNLDAVRDRVRILPFDCGDPRVLDKHLPGVDRVWHLAANPDVRLGADDPAAHYRSNVQVTWNLLEGMRRNGVGEILFTSTSTVYGRARVRPTPESYGPLLPISVYGGAKLGAEGLISSYCGTFGLRAQVFRFANVVGARAAHGVVGDFVRKLRTDPTRLEVLGDGTQTKSYVSVEDTVAAMLKASKRKLEPGACEVYNIGSRDAIPVTRVAEVVAKELKARPQLDFTGGAPDGAGWLGDVKQMGLDVRRLRGVGWSPRHTSEQAIRRAAKWAIANQPPPQPSAAPSPAPASSPAAPDLAARQSEMLASQPLLLA